jgi:hypothetical protein
VAFEDVPPVRRFFSVKGQRHFPGWYYAVTTGRHVGFESWLERDHAMLLDYDPQVVGFSSQPFWLHWPAGEKVRRHAPDYFARKADGTGVVVDVRPDERIEPRDAESFEATRQACELVGWEFRRLGTVAPVLVRNLRWLSRYRHPRCCGGDGVAERLLEAFEQATPLFEGAGVVGDRLAVLPVLYHLMWHRRLVARLESEVLGPSTLVRSGWPGGAR